MDKMVYVLPTLAVGLLAATGVGEKRKTLLKKANYYQQKRRLRMRFSRNTIEGMKYYVYGLRYPKTKKYFYIEKLKRK